MPRLMLSLGVTALVLLVLGCAPGGAEGEACAAPGDCAAREQALCDACAAQATQLCVEGVCEAAETRLAAVVVDVMLHFSLTGDVSSLLYAFVDQRPASPDADSISCDGLARSQPSVTDAAVNVTHSGFVNLQQTSGTAFFPDSNFGSAPIGRHLLDVRGYTSARGEGELSARACVAAIDVVDSDENRLELNLDPID